MSMSSLADSAQLALAADAARAEQHPADAADMRPSRFTRRAGRRAARVGPSGAPTRAPRARARRLESVRLVQAGGGGDDPLDNEEQLADQMDSLPFLARFQYEASAKYLTGLFDPLAVLYKARAKVGRPCSARFTVMVGLG
jgi:hypothetical protein